MTLNDRLEWLLLGIVIGYVVSRLGEMVKYLREIKEKVDDVDKRVHSKQNEAGFMRRPLVADLCMIIALALTVWAAVISGRSAAKVQDNQDDTLRTTYCTQQFLSKTIAGLNQRTKYTQDRADANVELQKAQARFIGILLIQPPKTEEEQKRSLVNYFATLNNFIHASEQAATDVKTNPFPTNRGLAKCLRKTSATSTQK